MYKTGSLHLLISERTLLFLLAVYFEATTKIVFSTVLRGLSAGFVIASYWIPWYMLELFFRTKRIGGIGLK